MASTRYSSFKSLGDSFLNTVILLTSGASVTWAHHAILAGYRKQAIIALAVTVALAAVFTGFQAYEYFEAPFDISDGIYGSTFFMATDSTDSTLSSEQFS